MHLNATYKNSWNRKQNKVCVTLDSELYRRKPVLTYAISGNVVGGFGEFGEYSYNGRPIRDSQCLYELPVCHYDLLIQKNLRSFITVKAHCS